MLRVGIYGYECIRECSFSGYKIVPLYANYNKVKNFSSDSKLYHLTAFVEIDDTYCGSIDSLCFDLEAVLSFADQRDVIIRHQLRDCESYSKLDEDYPLFLEGYNRRSGGGGVILSDAFSTDTRENYIYLAMNKLQGETDADKSFRSAFFKTIEIFRARENFIDVSYYLLFSGLESFCRAIENDYSSKNSAEPITRVLKNYGFDIEQESLSEPKKSVMTYVHLRNALFHNGKLEKKVNTPSGGVVTYTQSQYYSTFSRLVPLLLLKYTGFDDGHINWNSWLDRQPFCVRK
ncbi:hypothetical protein ACPUEJ_20030 [Vibrio tubiashii]|uniref:hypothetical protein n=1 Tax=Vibrio tubiashii TaxID=29498 RepID=UPI003CE5A141